MPAPSTVHQSTALTNLAIATPPTGFIAPSILPDLTVLNAAGKYYKFDVNKRGSAEVNDSREPGAEAKEVDFEVTTDTYDTDGHSLRAIVTDEEARDADSVIEPMQDKTEFLLDELNMAQEIDCKTILDAALTGAQTATPANNWDDYVNGDPLSDILTAIKAVEDGTVGKTPNIIAMDSEVWRRLQNHPDMVERVKAGGSNNDPGIMSLSGFAQFFNFEEVIIGNAQKNTALQGQTASMSRVWGGDVYIAFRPTRPGKKIPALGYRFVWGATLRGKGWSITTWREHKRKGNMVQADKYYDQKITLAGAGYRIVAVI